MCTQHCEHYYFSSKLPADSFSGHTSQRDRFFMQHRRLAYAEGSAGARGVRGLAHSDSVLRHHYFIQLWGDMLPTECSSGGNSWPRSDADLAARRGFPDQLLLFDADFGAVMIHRRRFVLIFGV